MRDRVLLVFAALTLQACTIAYYDLRNRLENPLTSRAACHSTYSIDLASGSYTNTFGLRETGRQRLQQAKDKYIADTRDVLGSKGCRAAYVEKEDEAILQVRIQHLGHISALPQEWLTGLSFGLIPSWGTRPSEYTYSFKHTPTGKSHTYTVDSKSYNHLILFPVFWITFFTLDERGVYKDALENFLEHS